MYDVDAAATADDDDDDDDDDNDFFIVQSVCRIRSGNYYSYLQKRI